MIRDSPGMEAMAREVNWVDFISNEWLLLFKDLHNLLSQIQNVCL